MPPLVTDREVLTFKAGTTTKLQIDGGKNKEEGKVKYTLKIEDESVARIYSKSTETRIANAESDDLEILDTQTEKPDEKILESNGRVLAKDNIDSSLSFS